MAESNYKKIMARVIKINSMIDFGKEFRTITNFTELTDQVTSVYQLTFANCKRNIVLPLKDGLAVCGLGEFLSLFTTVLKHIQYSVHAQF